MQWTLSYPLQTEVGYWFVWSLKIAADPTTHTHLNTRSILLQRLNNFATTWKLCFNPRMLDAACQGFHLHAAFICCSALGRARSLSESLTLAHRLSSWSPHQWKFTNLQLQQDEYWALLKVSDRGFLSIAITFSLLLILSHLYCSLFLILALLSPSLFSPPSFSCPLLSLRTSFYMTPLSSPRLNQGVIDNVLPSVSTLVNSFLLVFSLSSVFSNAGGHFVPHFTSPQSPRCLHSDTLVAILEKDEIPERPLPTPL